MMVLDDLYTQDNTVEWTAVNSGSHDIEGNESSYEVKSTVNVMVLLLLYLDSISSKV